MLSLSPAKLLVILVVALIVLGPEKLPQMARQLGAFWHDLRQWRGRLESEVRGAFPNLPPPDEVARVVRSPLAFLDRLADEHERSLADADEPSVDGSPTDGGGGPAPPTGSELDQAVAQPPDSAGEGATSNGVTTNGATTNGAATNGATTNGAASNGDGVLRGAESFLGQHPSGTGPMAPDDPSMN